MKLPFAPRHAGWVVWLLVVLLLLLAGWTCRNAGLPLLRSGLPAGAETASPETRRIRDALASLAYLKNFQSPRDGRTGQPEDTASSQAPPSGSKDSKGSTASVIVAPSPVARTDLAGAASASPGLGADASLIVIQTGQRFVAVVDGQTVRVGQTLPGGDVVGQIGKTFVVVRTPSGQTRRLDMQNRFLPRSITSQEKTK